MASYMIDLVQDTIKVAKELGLAKEDAIAHVIFVYDLSQEDALALDWLVNHGAIAGKLFDLI